MSDLQGIEEKILADGRVATPQLELLQHELYANEKIDRQEADFLVELYKRVQHKTPAFEHFFYQAIKAHLLADGRIDAEDTTWLRRMLFTDSQIADLERTFMHELKGEAKHASPEFMHLFADCMKELQEQHTSG